MRWNWQQPDWPEFSWDSARLRKAEEHFLFGAGLLSGAARHTRESDRQQLRAESLTSEATATSAIEGEILDRASIQSSIQRQLGMEAERRRIAPAEQGIAEIAVDLNLRFAQPLSDETLFAWHGMVSRGRADLLDVGRYRTNPEAMQVVSSSLDEPTVHFEAPAAASVPAEMSRFVGWFNRTGPGGSEPLPALTRAGIAHLYFESIHPFEDGNGRIGRALCEKAIAQALGDSPLIALSETILRRRKAYYQMLELSNKSNRITPWLAWFAGIAIEAQRRAMARVEFVLDKTKLLDRLRGQLNDRQEKALLRMLREGPEGFRGGLSASNYTAITGASPATGTRDLADLVAKSALVRTGERRHTRYTLAIRARPVAAVMLDDNGDLE